MQAQARSTRRTIPGHRRRRRTMSDGCLAVLGPGPGRRRVMFHARIFFMSAYRRSPVGPLPARVMELFESVTAAAGFSQ